MESTGGPNDKVSLELSDGVAEIRLTYPEKRNCFSPELVADLHDALLTASEYDELAAILLTADGPVYSAGADRRILDKDPTDVSEISDTLYDIFEWLRNTPVAVVSAARGPAIGAGASWFCYVADLKIAAPEVEIWWPEIKLGRVTYPRSVFLTTEVGPSKAAEMLLLGEKLGAKEGEQLGLFNRVVDGEEVEPLGREIAETLASHEREYGLNAEYLNAIYQSRREADAASTLWSSWKANTLPYEDVE